MSSRMHEAGTETVTLVGVKADGSERVLGTAPLPPSMKRTEIARQYFGPLTPDESGNDADLCLSALEQYHEWLEQQGWTAPAWVVSAAG